MPLKSPRFASDTRLQNAAVNTPPMRKGESGEPVRKVQQALIDVGFPLPASTSRTGWPDGIFGTETFDAAMSFQGRERLQQDGVVGKETLERLDTLLPGGGIPLPPKERLVPYIVPGMKSRQAQPTRNSCWATAYAMMYGWRNSIDVTPRAAVDLLGAKWAAYYDADQGLPIYENIAFASAAGLRAEPLSSLPPDAWAILLRQYGLLWFCYGWAVAGLNGAANRKGRHAVVLEGIVGDGSSENSGIQYTDPGDGRMHENPFDNFVEDYELGFTLSGDLPNWKVAGFSQILHY